MPAKLDPMKGVRVDGTQVIDDDGTLSAGIVATADIADDAITTAKIAAGAVDTTELAADAVTGAKIEDDAVSLEHLDPGITPSHIVAFAGRLTMGGGNASEAETVTGVAATDIVVATIVDNSTNDDLVLLEAKPTTNTLTFLFNEDPGASVVVSYAVYRAVS